jgi:transcriptional regulator with GAF, ATPase, and Fis domain
MIERALITANGDTVLELPGPLGKESESSWTPFDRADKQDLQSIERDYIVEILDQTNWKVSGDGGAAEILGMPTSTLRSKMKRLGIERSAP